MPRKSRKVLDIVSPVAESRQAGTMRGTARTGLEGKSVVALPSQKSSSPPFISALVERMKAAGPAAQVFSENADWPYFHPDKSEEIPGKIDEVAKRCDAAVVGIAY